MYYFIVCFCIVKQPLIVAAGSQTIFFFMCTGLTYLPWFFFSLSYFNSFLSSLASSLYSNTTVDLKDFLKHLCFYLSSDVRVIAWIGLALKDLWESLCYRQYFVYAYNLQAMSSRFC